MQKVNVGSRRGVHLWVLTAYCIGLLHRVTLRYSLRARLSPEGEAIVRFLGRASNDIFPPLLISRRSFCACPTGAAGTLPHNH